MSSNHAVLELRGATFRLGRQQILAGVDLHVVSGAMLALTGPNGAGKSTLLRLLAGSLPWQRGKIVLAGQGAARRSVSMRQQVGFAPDLPPLDEQLSATEFLTQVALARGLNTVAARQTVAETLNRLGMDDKVRRRCGDLSFGAAARLNLAQSLVGQPALWLIDEAVNGLDANAREQVRQVMTEELQRGSAIIMASHEWQHWQDLASDTLVLENGRLGKVPTSGHRGGWLVTVARAPDQDFWVAFDQVTATPTQIPNQFHLQAPSEAALDSVLAALVDQFGLRELIREKST